MSFVTGFIVGIVAGAAIIGLLGVLLSTREPSPPDPPEELYSCPYHGEVFYSEKEAYSHAVESHGAPVDGDAWKQTYSGGVDTDV